VSSGSVERRPTDDIEEAFQAEVLDDAFGERRSTSGAAGSPPT